VAHLARKWRWRTSQFVRTDVIFLTALLTVLALVRGFDYATGDDSEGATLSLVEKAFPLPLWGALFMFGGGLIAAGMLLHIHPVVFVGHCLLAVTYAMLTVGLFVALPGFPFDGIRTATGLTAIVWLHYFLALRMGPRPIDGSVECTAERVVSQA
jgi:hypothetical protein